MMQVVKEKESESSNSPNSVKSNSGKMSRVCDKTFKTVSYNHPMKTKILLKKKITPSIEKSDAAPSPRDAPSGTPRYRVHARTQCAELHE